LQLGQQLLLLRAEHANSNSSSGGGNAVKPLAGAAGEAEWVSAAAACKLDMDHVRQLVRGACGDWLQ
jgi:hypothetical protein